MNILITGADGQLGAEFRDLSKHYSTYNFLFTNHHDLDICNEGAVKDFLVGNSVNFIINCAAYTAVDKAEDDAVDCDKINHAGIANLALAASNAEAKLIHFSTDYVFDGTKCLPYTEEDHTSARTIYGITKLAGERVALAKCKETMIIRTSWLYSSFKHNFVKTVMNCLTNKGQMNVVCDQLGTPTYARDLAQFVLDQVHKEIVPGVYHYSNEGTCSWFDFAKMIQRFANLPGSIQPILTSEYPTLAKRPAYSVLDKSKIKETYNISIPYWVDSLEECINKILKDN